MKVSIIILNWNGGKENCVEAVESALNQSYNDKEIIFVDNGSTDGSNRLIAEKFPEIKFVQIEENLGCPGGRNVGAEHAAGDLLFFFENDGIWPETDVVATVVEKFRQYPNIGALYLRVEGFSSRTPDPPLDIKPGYEYTDGLYLSSSFRGGASAIKTQLFFNAGKFPGDFFRQYEERYLSLLIYQLGYEVVYFPEKVLLHKGSDYKGKSDDVLKYNCINELKTIIRIYPSVLWVGYFVLKFLIWSVRLKRLGRKNFPRVHFSEIITSGLGKQNRIAIKTLRQVQHIRYCNKPIKIE